MNYKKVKLNLQTIKLQTEIELLETSNDVCDGEKKALLSRMAELQSEEVSLSIQIV